MKRNSYNTKQKEVIMDIVKEYNHEFTVKDIYNKLGNNIGLTTIYRFIDNLYKEGYLNKNVGEDNNTYYQYLVKCDNENHFYLKCDKCGLLEHVDCDCINDLNHHISNNHKFRPSRDHIIINGICDKCYGKEKKHEKI